MCALIHHCLAASGKQAGGTGLYVCALSPEHVTLTCPLLDDPKVGTDKSARESWPCREPRVTREVD